MFHRNKGLLLFAAVGMTGSHGYATLVMPSTLLTNWTVKLVYSPHVVVQMKRSLERIVGVKEKCREIVAEVKKREAEG